MSKELPDHSPLESAEETAPSRWAQATAGRVEAFKELAESYWYCAYAWWRRAGLDTTDAGNATLACFSQWIEQAPPKESDANVGRMREWMAGRLAELAQAGAELEVLEPAAVTIDPTWAENRYADEPAGEAEVIYQRRWALTVIEFTAATLRGEYAERGEEELFDELLAFSGFGSGDEDQYRAAAARLQCSTGAMHKAVFDFRTHQREVLRIYAADTLLNGEDANREITALSKALGAADPDSESAPLPSEIQQLRPDEVLARAMHTVQMTKAGPGGWRPPTLTEVARLFPQYEMITLVGRGGMGAVYKARETELDRLVAIKLLPLEVSAQGDFAQRFRREAQTMAKLNHPNIISVHDFGTTSEGHLFFVMDFIQGANLQEMIRGRGVAPLHALSIVSGICDALAYAHSKGVVHRDIKPANVMITVEGQAKVADFGLARLTDPTAEHTGYTMTGTVMGTTSYMAPEQMRGSDVDHRADIYSLGVTLYEILCGKVPRGVFDPPSAQVPGVNAGVDLVVTRAMQQQPERRYQSTLEMKSDISAATSALLLRPRHRSAPATPGREMRAKQSKAPLLLGLAVALAAGGLGAHYLMSRKNSGEPAPKDGAVEPASKPGSTEEKTPSEPAASAPAVAEKSGAASAASNETPGPSGPTPAPAVKPQTAEQSKADTPLPATRPPPKSEVAIWLDQVDAQYRSPYLKEVVEPYRAELAKQVQATLASLEHALASATQSGKLEEAVALRAERQRLLEGEGIPTDDADKPPAALKQLRDAYRFQVSTLEQARVKAAEIHLGPYDKTLAARQAQLTQSQQLDDAILVKTRREQIAKEWLKKQVPLWAASKESPFINTLGMKFVPAPITGGPTDGQLVLFSVWDTRVQDYEMFVKETKHDWPKAEFEQGSTHPAVRVTWDDATAFCAWLSNREHRAGILDLRSSYRLPSDHEWSCAVELGSREDAAKSPAEKSGKIDDVFVWGSQWPPPPGAGNFAGEEVQAAMDAGKLSANVRFSLKGTITGYNDGYVTTSPVGKFGANRFGLSDLAGNVWNWTADWFDENQLERVVRGGAWPYDQRSLLLSSRRGNGEPGLRSLSGGFRCVLGATLPPSAPPTAGSIPQVGEWRDFLAQLTPNTVEQIGHGWRLDGGVLRSPAHQESNAFGTLPFPGTYAGTSYVVRVKVRVTSFQDVFSVILPVGDRMVGFEVDGFGGKYTGLNRVDEKRGADLPGVVEGRQIKDLLPHDLEVTVRLNGANAQISSTLDGRPFYEWAGPIAPLSVSKDISSTIRLGAIGFASKFDNWLVSEMKVKRLEN